MNFLRLTLCCILFSLTLPSYGQSFDFNENCESAYQAIFKLKFKEGEALLNKESSDNPNNLMPVFLANYIDFLSLYISEDEELFKRIESRKKERLGQLEDGPKDSPYYLYTQADLHLQWAFSRLKFEEYINAFFEIRKAHKLLKENEKKFPDFLPNKKSLGLLHALFGAIPDKYKTGAKIFGMTGSIEQGVAEMNEAIQSPGFAFKEEAIIMYTMLQLHLNKNSEEAWKMVNNSQIPLGDNLLNYYIAGSVAYYSGRNDEMIDILLKKPAGQEYFPFPFLDHLLGLAKLNRLDDDADVYFKLFLRDFQGKTYIKETHRKLAWFYYVNDDVVSYKKEMQLCLNQGTTLIDEDKSAMKEAERAVFPHKELLQARILFDGAYTDRALSIMQTIDYESLKSAYTQTEYFYRYGRIYDKMNEENLAITNYKKAIELGAMLPTYYAVNASLKLGLIYEEKKNKALANKYYRQCLNFDKHEYKNSIDAEAKAGLNRLKSM